MDGVSIAASIIGIGAAGSQIAIKLYTLASQISTASDRISSISNDVSLTSAVLHQLGELMTTTSIEDGTTIFSQGGLDTTKASAAMCETIFQDVERAAREASVQVQGRGRFTGGKVKLSRSERLKWPFLQPSMDILRKDLQEAKATLMLMLQVNLLAFSKQMAEINHAVSANIVEQREIIGAILAIQRQQHSCQVVKQQRLSPGPSRGDKSNAALSNTPNEVSSWSDSAQSSLPGGGVLAPTESPVDGKAEGLKSLEFFLMKSIIEDLGDVIQLSWKVQNIQMHEAVIRKQIMKDDNEGLPLVLEVYQDLYAHEHVALEESISRAGAGSDVSLRSLKRIYTDMTHRKILFKGVPGLQFVLERTIQQPPPQKTPTTPAQSAAATPLQPKRSKDGKKLSLKDFLDDTSLGSWADEIDDTPASAPTRLPVENDRSYVKDHIDEERLRGTAAASNVQEREKGNTTHKNFSPIAPDKIQLSWPRHRAMNSKIPLPSQPSQFSFGLHRAASDEQDIPSTIHDHSIDYSEDDEDNEDNVDIIGRGRNESEADRLVEELLGKYTTLFEGSGKEGWRKTELKEIPDGTL